MMSAVIDHLWQSTLFVVVAWLFTLVLRNNAASVRYWVWMAASIKFLIPFSLLTALGSQFSWREAEPLQVTQSFATTVQEFVEPLSTPDIVLSAPQTQSFDYVSLLLTMWISGGVLLLLRWGLSWWRVSTAVRKAQPIEIQAPIAVKSTSKMSEPGVVGVVRPVLLLPEGIAARLTPAQLQAVLAHELCHVRRRDNLTAAIHMLVEVLFWFHPLVWWIGARLVEERERACDEGVVELGNEPQAYAEGILKVCQFYVESKLPCVAGVSGADLKKRVESIMRNRIGETLGFAKRSLLVLCASLALIAPIAFGLITAAPKLVQAQQATGFTPIDDALSVELVPAGQGPHDDDSTATLVNRGQSVRDLIAGSYQLQQQQIVGAPQWIDAQRFDVVRRGVKSTELDMRALNELNTLERKVLTEKLGLKFHREMRSMSAYVLGLSASGRNAFRLQEASPNYTGGYIQTSIPRPEIEVMPRMMRAAPMRSLAWHLAKGLNSVVLDHTGLAGAYSYELDGRANQGNVAAVLDAQLGLRLDLRTELVEVFVVDAIQQPANASNLRAERPSSSAPRLILSDESKEASIDPALRRNQFRGEPINMKFGRVEVRQLLENLARIYGKSVVIDPRIQGRLSGDVNNIPWDQVLDEIVRFKGLVSREDGGTLYIDAVPGNAPAAQDSPNRGASVTVRTGPRLKLGDERNEIELNAALRSSQFPGDRLNFKLDKTNVRTAIDLLAKAGGRTIVLDPTIEGWLSTDIDDVAWDQALEEIVRFKQWTVSRTGDVIYIGARTGGRSVSPIGTIVAVGGADNLVVPVVAKLRASQRGNGPGMQLVFDGDTLNAANMTLKELVQTAYDPNLAPTYISGGPLWVDGSRFDVTIKLGSPLRMPDTAGPKELSLARVQTQMLRKELQKLLANEFSLVVRSEKKISGYRLVALPGGAKLQAAKSPGSTNAQLREDQGGIIGQSVSTQQLSAALSKQLSLPILNRTELYGRYDLAFSWPVGLKAGDAYRLSQALTEQLGLELKAVAIDTLVIDRAARPARLVSI